jgi:peroxiredoxin
MRDHASRSSLNNDRQPAEVTLNEQKAPSQPSNGKPVQAENRNLSLSSRLSVYRKESEVRLPAFAKAYDDLVQRLNLLDAGKVGPQLGEVMPRFDLPNESGQLISLSSLVRSGPIVISINRGHWCPYCKLELRSLAAINDEVERLGAHIISIMPDSARFTEHYVASNDLPFPILSDVDLGYSLSLGLIFWVGAQIQKLYRDVGIELEKYHGNQGHFLPMAAKFVVGRDGKVKARQVNLEFRERMEPEAVIAMLRDLAAA